MTYSFSRRPHLISSKMISLNVNFQNTSGSMLSGIAISNPQLQAGMKMSADVSIRSLPPGDSHSASVGINFNDTLQPAKFEIW